MSALGAQVRLTVGKHIGYFNGPSPFPGANIEDLEAFITVLPDRGLEEGIVGGRAEDQTHKMSKFVSSGEFDVYSWEKPRTPLHRFQIAAHPREHCSWMSRFLVLVLVGSISPVFLVSEGLVPADIIIRFKLTSEESGKWEVLPAAILHQPLVDGRANGCCFPIDRG